MKFLILFAAAAASAAAAALLLSGCGGNVVKVTNDDGSANYVMTVDADVTELDEQTTLYDYMCALREAGELTFEAELGEYGYFIVSVEGVENTAESATSGYAWTIYTDLSELDGVIYSDASYDTWEYDGRQLASANYGISGLPAVEGYTYALVYSHYSY